MKARKILVPVDIENPKKTINDILYPKILNKEASFVRIKNGKIWEYGMVILIGGGINENDLFTKIVDSKAKIESVKKLLNILTLYLDKVKEFSIGNIVYIESLDDEGGFILKKYANRLNVKRKSRLP